MITGILAKILGTDNERKIQKLRPIVNQINALEPSISKLTDEQLGEKTNEFRKQLSQGKTLDDILPEAFACVREAAKRTLGQRHFDVQLMGGIVLHQGKIAEMKTGEGKTLTATLALYLNALEGKGAHLVTVNDYLARRDAEWMRPVYTMLGLTVGCLQNNMDDAERKEAYANDILYATNNELGFDYLRDNMKFRLEDYVQRDLNYAIVDEVDSILIDEARTPLIISGSAEASSKLYIDANRVAASLKKGVDYEVDEKARTALLTESGVDKIEQAFHIDNLYAIEHMNLLHHMNQAVRAHALFRRDVEYVVRDNQVLIVDEFTGRILSGRRYSDGLHQALEAKEGVPIERESQTLASITLQNYFRLYKKLAGMTGTAATEAEEFYNIYGLDVVVIPTNVPLARADKPHLIFLTKNSKYKAIAQDIKERYAKKQPVLVGTASIETSELLSNVLHAQGLPHDVLNAKQHQREAEIIEHAGEPGRITIATNMAGRGTDIKLTPESKETGGLYILGTELHESRRIDNQLRGRAGRQGDKGESRFYISLEDDLIRIFAGDNLKKNMERFGMKEDEVIESPIVSRTIDRAQEKVEKHNFEIRKHLLEYDDVLNQQRMVIYRYRRDILEGEHRTYELVRDFITKVIQDLVFAHCSKRTVTHEQANLIMHEISQLFGLTPEMLHDAKINTTTVASLESDLTQFILSRYELLRNQVHAEAFQQAEKWLLLETIDQAWKQHMLNLDHLKEGIGLRGWGQKNPLIEYKREAFDMFREMLSDIYKDVVRHIFRLKVDQFDERELEEKREKELDELRMISSETGPAEPAQRAEDKIGRNDPCPCGSGKKYKKCCGVGK
ncbi:MAG TPA: preprotein translocase subunit SecA [Candidatus Dependentiae bacterium]|nr:preprotein translocase subunit SecA [Candidatus Dependentiae bacterium]HRQ62935.1 preprotein translocase subunit SecA [Candidatus Dependentiae bacterium]